MLAVADVAVTAPLPGPALERLAKVHDVRVRPQGTPLAGVDLARFAGTSEALICLLADRADHDFFRLCRTVRVVANYAVGFNNVDIDAASEAGVWVTNTPDVLTDATAECTWALVLAVARRVVEGDRLVRSGGFSGWRPDLLLGGGLSGTTLGIVGFGRIGQAVGRRAAAFGMDVVVHSPRPADDRWVRYEPDLDALLAAAHVVSLHCPLTPATHHLLDARRIGLMRRDTILINTSRGEIVDEAALVVALAEGRLAGAGLDVYEREPALCPGLVDLPNVVLLPHIGSATREARAAMADLAVDNVMAVLAGRPPITPVNTPVLSRLD